MRVETLHTKRDKQFWNEQALIDPFFAACDGKIKEDFKMLNKKDFDYYKTIMNDTDLVLDIGCGFGRLCPYIAQIVRKYVGVDYSENMIIEAKKYNLKFKNAFFEVDDARELMLLINDYFSIAVCNLVFLHNEKEDFKKIISAAHRVLKKGGVFYCDIPSPMYESGVVEEEANNLFNSFNYSEITPIMTEYEGVKGVYYYAVKATK